MMISVRNINFSDDFSATLYLLYLFIIKSLTGFAKICKITFLVKKIWKNLRLKMGKLKAYTALTHTLWF